MAKALRVLPLILALLLTLGGCAGAPRRDSEEEALLLGFAQLGSESAWRLGNTRSVQEAAQRAGIQLMYENAEQKQEKQIKAIRSFIAYQVDVIAFAPIVEDGWDTVLMEAREAGIPVPVSYTHLDVYKRQKDSHTIPQYRCKTTDLMEIIL